MIKKKAKTKTAVKKAAKKKSGTKGKKEQNPAEVRKDISELVKSHAGTLAQAVINEGEKGQLAPVKFLFEVANIFPPATDGSEATKEEDSLAKTLLDRLNIPAVPIVQDDEDSETVVIHAKKDPEQEETDAESRKGSGEGSSEEAAGEKEVTAM